MRRWLIQAIFIVLLATSLNVFNIAAQVPGQTIPGTLGVDPELQPPQTEHQSQNQEPANQSAAPNEILKSLTCPAEVTVGALSSLGNWRLPTSTAKYADVKLEIRNLGGREYYSTVCSYTAFRGRISIERVMGPKSVLSDCGVIVIQSGTGGVRCI